MSEYVVVTPAIGMFFPAVDDICNRVMDAALQQGAGVHPVVFNCSHFTSLDTTAVKVIPIIHNF